MAGNKPKPCKIQIAPDCKRQVTTGSTTGGCQPCIRHLRRQLPADLDRGHARGADIVAALGRADAKIAETCSAIDWNADTKVFHGNAAVISDPHVPAHDRRLLRGLCQVGVIHGLDTLIVDGDFADMAMIHRYDSDGPQSSAKGALVEAVRTIGALLEIFKNIIVVGGNHDQIRIERTIDQAVKGRSRAEWILRDWERDEAEALPYERRYQAIMESHARAELGALAKRITWVTQTFMYVISGGRKWLITHQKVGSRNATIEANNLYAREKCSIWTGHTHLFGMRALASGTDLAVNAGCGTERRFHRYSVRHDSAYPEWVLGFGAIVDGDPYLYSPTARPGEWARLDRDFAEAAARAS